MLSHTKHIPLFLVISPFCACKANTSLHNEVVFRQKSLFILGCVQGAIVCLVCPSVCVSDCACYIHRFTDCESCTRPISTTSTSMGAGDYGLTRGTGFVASRLEVVAVAGELGISWCGLGGADCFRVFLLFERTRPTASKRPTCLMYPSTSKEAAVCL